MNYLVKSIVAILSFLTLLNIPSMGQVGIGTVTPDASAMLDVTSTTKGFLPPRVALTGTTDVATISSPATGLLVYNLGTGGLATAGYYYWNGSAWTALGGGSNLYTADGTLSGNRTVSTAGGYTLTFSPQTTFNPTVTAASASAVGTLFSPSLTAAANNDQLVGLNINPTFDRGAFTGLKTYGLMVEGIGIGRGGSSNQFNTAVGYNALKSNTTNSNTGVGYQALQNTTSGSDNTALGTNTLSSNTTGPGNTAIGSAALGSHNGGVGKNTAVGGLAAYATTSGYYNSVVGYEAFRFNTSGYGNVAIGFQSLYSNTLTNYSTAVGTEALRNFKPSSSSDYNVALGYRALQGATDFTGAGNVAVGYGALMSNSTGATNTVVGNDGLTSNTTGSNNQGFGRQALYFNTTGNDNTGLGHSALRSNTTGGNNVAVGNYALYSYNPSSGTGGNNTAVGRNAMFSLSTGTNNVSVGYNAGPVSGSGDVTNTLAIGYNASISGAGLTNCAAIGNGATVTASNTIQLGNASITTIQGQVSFTAVSDRRLKESITNSKYGLKEVMQLRPVDYILTSNRLKQVGFIAQEVQSLVPEVVTGKEGDLSKGETLGLTYANLVPVLTKAIQEQQAMIEQLKAEIEALKKGR